MLVEKKDPRIPDFAEVKDKVLKAVKEEKAKAQLEDKAKELIANAKAPSDLKAAAEKSRALNFYQLLKVGALASEDEIREAFHREACDEPPRRTRRESHKLQRSGSP